MAKRRAPDTIYSNGDVTLIATRSYLYEVEQFKLTKDAYFLEDASVKNEVELRKSDTEYIKSGNDTVGFKFYTLIGAPVKYLESNNFNKL